MAKCMECRFIDYFSSEDKHWCHQHRRYANPKDEACEKYKPKIKGSTRQIHMVVLPMLKRLLCKLGLHQWSKPTATYISGSNVKEFTKRCRRCGKQERWIEPA